MTCPTEFEVHDSQDLVLRHTHALGGLGRLCYGTALVMLACVGLPPIAAGAHDLVTNPSALAAVRFAVGALITVVFGSAGLRLALTCVRNARGRWWLRLSRTGVEINDRILRRRRYAWREIDDFLLLAPSRAVESAVLATVATYGESLSSGGGSDVTFRVGFRLVTGHRRTVGNRLCRAISGLSSRDGTRPDGLVMGQWDRPIGEAVNLMNEWRMRYTAA